MIETETARAPQTAVDISDQKIHWDQKMSYGQYLALEEVLACQRPLTAEHDEMLFIVIHQASELWMKLCIHEITAAMRQVDADELRPAFKMLARVARVQAQLQQSWDVLSTLTPADYMSFRDALGQSSGFQSYQYRQIEYALGNKNAAMAEVHRGHPQHYARLQETLRAPSFYDRCLMLLARRGFDIPPSHLKRDWSKPYVASDGVEAAWREIYRNTAKHWELYELAEKLVDLEHHFHHWRFSHMKTVERIIGYKRGTGGTAGVAYLVKALDLRFFPELWTVRTSL